MLTLHPVLAGTCFRAGHIGAVVGAGAHAAVAVIIIGGAIIVIARNTLVYVRRDAGSKLARRFAQADVGLVPNTGHPLTGRVSCDPAEAVGLGTVVVEIDENVKRSAGTRCPRNREHQIVILQNLEGVSGADSDRDAVRRAVIPDVLVQQPIGQYIYLPVVVEQDAPLRIAEEVCIAISGEPHDEGPINLDGSELDAHEAVAGAGRAPVNSFSRVCDGGPAIAVLDSAQTVVVGLLNSDSPRPRDAALLDRARQRPNAGTIKTEVAIGERVAIHAGCSILHRLLHASAVGAVDGCMADKLIRDAEAEPGRAHVAGCGEKRVHMEENKLKQRGTFSGREEAARDCSGERFVKVTTAVT